MHLTPSHHRDTLFVYFNLLVLLMHVNDFLDNDDCCQNADIITHSREPSNPRRILGFVL